MRVKIDNEEEQNIAGTLESINDWWVQATSHVYKSKRLIYFVEIDGHSYYDGYELFIVKNFHIINQLRIVTKSHQESIDETVGLLKQYLAEFIPTAESTADFLYGDISSNQWSVFSQFLEGLNWIVSSLEFLKSLSSNNYSYKPLLDSLGEIIIDLDKYLQGQDYVEVGDLICYELIPVLRKIKQVSDEQEISLQ